MSGIASMALPGRIPVAGSGRDITPESLFSNQQERAMYQRLLDARMGIGLAPDVKVNKVSVRIFDFSDQNQVEEYENLWAELLEKTARNEVIVEAQKDLVRRKDGTSYWMKYVEYVEFGEASKSNDQDGKDGKNGK
jgi:hypothetical protein